MSRQEELANWCTDSECPKHGNCDLCMYEKGKADREQEIIENINHYINMLINAMNDKEENPILHNALANERATEIRVRKLIIDQIKAGETE